MSDLSKVLCGADYNLSLLIRSRSDLTRHDTGGCCCRIIQFPARVGLSESDLSRSLPVTARRAGLLLSNPRLWCLRNAACPD